MVVDDKPPLHLRLDGAVGLDEGLEGLVVGGGPGDEVRGVVREAEGLAAAVGEEARHGDAEDVVVVQQAELIGIVFARNLVGENLDKRVYLWMEIAICYLPISTEIARRARNKVKYKRFFTLGCIIAILVVNQRCKSQTKTLMIFDDR